MNTPIDSNTRERMRSALALLKGAAARLEARQRAPVDVAVDAVDAALGGGTRYAPVKLPFAWRTPETEA